MTGRELIGAIKDTVREAGQIILDASVSANTIFSKEGRANYFTVYDERVQEFLITRFTKLLPAAHFVGEEEGKDFFGPGYETGYTFVIDPIDGTSNFMHDLHMSVCSVGLFLDGEPYIGVVYNPYTDQMFSALRGEGAYENDQRLRTADDPLSRSLVNIGTAPYYAEEITRSAFEIGHWYLKRCIDVRRTGSGEWDFCMVASGRAGLFFEPYMSLWDYAAGALIVMEAGGIVTDQYGKPLSFRGGSSICAVTKGAAREDYLPPKELCAGAE